MYAHTSVHVHVSLFLHLECSTSQPKRENWSLEQMNDFATKLGFIRCEQQTISDQDVRYYQGVYEVSMIVFYVL